MSRIRFALIATVLMIACSSSANRAQPVTEAKATPADHGLGVEFGDDNTDPAYTCAITPGGGECGCDPKVEDNTDSNTCDGLRIECAARGATSVVCTFEPGEGSTNGHCFCCWGDRISGCSDRTFPESGSGDAPHPE